MIVVYVKHYLDKDGFDYFEKTWFPQKVQPIISKQPGFISIEAKTDNTAGHVFITVIFDSEENLAKWVSKPEHDVMDLLDPFRTKNYWEAAKSEERTIAPEKLSWKQIKAKKNH